MTGAAQGGSATAMMEIERVTCSLATLKTGDVGVVQRIASHEARSKRLADMGFVRGARLEVVRRGHPCIVQLDGTRVGLGRLHQASIELSVD